MEIKFLNQPKDVKLIDILSEKMRNKEYTKMWIVAGFTKDSALDCILEDVKIARENGAIIECVWGLDKKNTSKDMLLKFLEMGCNIRYHLNDDGAKLESRLFAFENPEGDSYVYITGGKFSEGGISSNLTIIEEIIYSKNEKKEFGKVKAAIENGISDEEFGVLTYDRLKELASSGDIAARIIERKIPSISELYNDLDKEVSNSSIEYDESAGSNFKDLLSQDINIDIDLNESGVTVQNSLGEEVEHKLKKEIKEKEDVVISKIINTDKEMNFEDMTTLILYAGKNLEKCEIKIPSSITANLFKFLGYPDLFHTEKDEKGNLKEFSKFSLEIFENEDKITEKTDEACFVQSAKYTSIKTDLLKDFTINEDDILRLIKISEKEYRLEIIKKDSSEYSIWEGFITYTCKGSTKKIGIL